MKKLWLLLMAVFFIAINLTAQTRMYEYNSEVLVETASKNGIPFSIKSMRNMRTVFSLTDEGFSFSMGRNNVEALRRVLEAQMEYVSYVVENGLRIVHGGKSGRFLVDYPRYTTLWFSIGTLGDGSEEDITITALLEKPITRQYNEPIRMTFSPNGIRDIIGALDKAIIHQDQLKENKEELDNILTAINQSYK